MDWTVVSMVHENRVDVDPQQIYKLNHAIHVQNIITVINIGQRTRQMEIIKERLTIYFSTFSKSPVQYFCPVVMLPLFFTYCFKVFWRKAVGKCRKCNFILLLHPNLLKLVYIVLTVFT